MHVRLLMMVSVGSGEFFMVGAFRVLLIVGMQMGGTVAAAGIFLQCVGTFV